MTLGVNEVYNQSKKMNFCQISLKRPVFFPLLIIYIFVILFYIFSNDLSIIKKYINYFISIQSYKNTLVILLYILYIDVGSMMLSWVGSIFETLDVPIGIWCQ